MINESIIQKQVHDLYERIASQQHVFTLYKSVDDAIAEIRTYGSRFYGANQLIFFDAVCNEIVTGIARHRQICRQAPSTCKLEEGMNTLLFFMRQECDELIKSKVGLVAADEAQLPDNANETVSFEEKQMHFLRLLYDTGSKEHEKRNIYINSDFPLALSSDREDFSRILESLSQEGLIDYSKNGVRGDHEGGLLSHYRDMILTPTGKQRVQTMKPTVSNENNKFQKMQSVFISHASADKKTIDELIDLLELIGVKPENIFCSSVPQYGIRPGQDFLARIKTEISADSLVIFAMSSQFLASPVCLCEMGAAWVLSKMHIPVLIPPFEFTDIKGVIPLTQGIKLVDAEQINAFAITIAEEFNLPSPLQNRSWERKRNRIIEQMNLVNSNSINKHINDKSKEGIPNSNASSMPLGGVQF